MSVLEVAPGEALVSQPSRKTIFAARRSDLRLVKVPRYPQFGQGGVKVGEAAGQAVQFGEGQFVLPESGDVELADGRKAPAAEIIEWLRGHKLYGNSMDGFWEVQTTAPPVSQEETARILDAATELDIDTLRLVLEQERAGWDRDDVTVPVERTIEKITAALAAAEERARAEAQAAVTPPPPPAAKPAAKKAAGA